MSGINRDWLLRDTVSFGGDKDFLELTMVTII